MSSCLLTLSSGKLFKLIAVVVEIKYLMLQVFKSASLVSQPQPLPGKEERQGWGGKREDHSPSSHKLPGIFILFGVNHPVVLRQSLEDKAASAYPRICEDLYAMLLVHVSFDQARQYFMF